MRSCHTQKQSHQHDGPETVEDDGNLHLLKLRDASAIRWDDLGNNVPNHVSRDGDATVRQQRDEIVKSQASSPWIEVVIDLFTNPLRNTLLMDIFGTSTALPMNCTGETFTVVATVGT